MRGNDAKAITAIIVLDTAVYCPLVRSFAPKCAVVQRFANGLKAAAVARVTIIKTLSISSIKCRAGNGGIWTF